MKKSLLTRLGAGALILTLVSTVLLSGTLAKYTSTVNGSVTGTAAKWSFTANGEKETFSKVLGILQPGSTGTIVIDLAKGDSDVDIDYDVTIKTATGVTLPDGLTFKTDNETAGTPAAYILETPLKGTLTEGVATKKITVTYNWAIDGNDANDLSVAGKSLNLDIAVVGTQATPSN